MKKFENPIMEIAFFEAENVCTTASSGTVTTAEQVATNELQTKFNVTNIKAVEWTF